jgi:CPW-WPC domain-containing protein
MGAPFHLLFLAVAHCASLRKVADLSDIESIARSAESVADGYLAESAKLPSSEQARKLVALQNAQSLGELHGALFSERRQAADAALGPAHCPKCTRTYLEVCPSGWQKGNEGVCEAPSGYDGPCKGYAYLSELAPAHKQRFEERCAVCWTCSEHSPPPTGHREGPVELRGADA